MLRYGLSLLALLGFMAVTLAACEVDVDDRAAELTEFVR